MENKTFTFPPLAAKYILRSTGEEVEVIDFNLPNRGMRTAPDENAIGIGDWVTYIDSQGQEHIREHLNVQLDFKPMSNNMFEKLFDATKTMSIRNSRIFETAKSLLIDGMCINDAVDQATRLVDAVEGDKSTTIK